MYFKYKNIRENLHVSVAYICRLVAKRSYMYVLHDVIVHYYLLKMSKIQDEINHHMLEHAK